MNLKEFTQNFVIYIGWDKGVQKAAKKSIIGG